MTYSDSEKATPIMRDLYAGVSSVDLVEALRLDATARRPRLCVGSEFAMVRTLRDRGLTPEGLRRPGARGIHAEAHARLALREGEVLGRGGQGQRTIFDMLTEAPR